jgi:hypothetical protein
MSILDFLIDIIIFFLNNTLGLLPEQFSGFELSAFNEILYSISFNFINGFNFIEYFFPVKLIFTLLGIILIAEILLHFGFKGIKYVLNLIRGSGA